MRLVTFAAFLLCSACVDAATPDVTGSAAIVSISAVPATAPLSSSGTVAVAASATAAASASATLAELERQLQMAEDEARRLQLQQQLDQAAQDQASGKPKVHHPSPNKHNCPPSDPLCQ